MTARFRSSAKPGAGAKRRPAEPPAILPDLRVGIRRERTEFRRVRGRAGVLGSRIGSNDRRETGVLPRSGRWRHGSEVDPVVDHRSGGGGMWIVRRRRRSGRHQAHRDGHRQHRPDRHRRVRPLGRRRRHDARGRQVGGGPGRRHRQLRRARRGTLQLRRDRGGRLRQRVHHRSVGDRGRQHPRGPRCRHPGRLRRRPGRAGQRHRARRAGSCPSPRSMARPTGRRSER